LLVLDATWVSEYDIPLRLIVDHLDLVGDSIWSCSLEVTMSHPILPEAMSLLACAALFVNTIAISAAKLEPTKVLIPIPIQSPPLPMRHPLFHISLIKFILILYIEPAEPIRLILHEPPLNDAVPSYLDPPALPLAVTDPHLPDVYDGVHEAEPVDGEYERRTLYFEFLLIDRGGARAVLKLSVLDSLQGLQIELVRVLAVAEDLLRVLVVELLVPLTVDEASTHLQVLIFC
jgi:hypothetical protein